MASQKSSYQNKLLYQLCSLYSKDAGDVEMLYRVGVSVLASGLSTVGMDEGRLLERVQKKLVQCRRDGDGVLFMELYQRLSSNPGRVLDGCSSLLCFLFQLMPGGVARQQGSAQASSFLLNTLSFPSLGPSPAPRQTGPAYQHTPGCVASVLSRSSGLGSTVYSSTSGDSTIRDSTGMPTGNDTTLPSNRYVPPYTSTPALGGVPVQPVAPPLSSVHPQERRLAWMPQDARPEATPTGAVLEPRPLSKQASEQDNEVTERELLEDLIYVFQGIDGHHLHYSSRDSAYRLRPKAIVPAPMREMCYKLAELGWLHRKVKKFVDSLNRSRGLVMQSFCVALSNELKEYYRLVAVLEAQTRQRGPEGTVGLTLHRVGVWMEEPRQRLQMLAVLADSCKHHRGGALVSCLYEYSQHGDPAVRRLVLHLLAQVYQPLHQVLQSWVFEGEVEDVFLEFFIACDDSAKPDKLWRSKYSLRPSMLPKFISRPLAQKIMTIGKSINFLRNLCDDHTSLGDRDRQQLHSDLKGRTGDQKDSDPFTVMTGPALRALVDHTYQETSKHLLHVMHTKYNLMEHIKALRRYLLLGQGDFVNHLMDLMVPYLDQPASTLYLHNLTGTLESAVRATNAQYDWPESLKRLDVRTLDLSPGDVGWDVFSLHYHVDGAISTVFNDDAMLKYLQVFNFLWRGKRMEYCLTSMWREQTSSARLLQPLTVLGGVLHQSHLLLSGMVHFITQLQYYLNFEVLECSWAKLLAKLEEAKDLDEVIDAHEYFLDEVTSQCLLDSGSQPLLTQLRTIYDLVIQFQSKQGALLEVGLRERDRRLELEASRDKHAAQGSWGVTRGEDEMEREKRVEFAKEIGGFSTDITLLHESFMDYVGSLMGDLKLTSEQSLQFLRFRLDFNQFYSRTLGMDTSVSQ